MQEAMVAPLAGAWIEMGGLAPEAADIVVAPLAGAWIEIETGTELYSKPIWSLPSRERGLKFSIHAHKRIPKWSLPLRERGLKFKAVYILKHGIVVAPLAGAWIEM